MNAGMKNAYLAVSSLFMTLICIVLFMMADKGYNPAFVMTCIVVAAGMILLQGIHNVKIRGIRSWLQVDLLFLLMFFFVHFWLWLSVALEWVDLSLLPPNYMRRVDFAVALALLGMAAFLMGYNLMPKVRPQQIVDIVGKRGWVVAGYVIFFMGAALTILYAFSVGSAAFEGQYGGSEVGSLTARVTYLLSGIFLKIGILIILIAKSDRSRYLPKAIVPLGVLAVVLLMQLVLGDRSEFIYTAGVVAFAYSTFYKRISLPVLVVGVLAVSILMSAVQIARRADSRSLSEIVDTISEGGDSVSVKAGLGNISASGGVLLAAVSAVPKEHDYFGGDLKTLELLGIIPFGRKFFYRDAEQRDYTNSSNFLTWYILGPNATSGTGTTVVADIYVDFGPTGVFIGLFVLGFITNLVRDKAARSQSFIMAVVFCYFAGLLVLLPRYSVLQVIRGLLWPILMLWGVQLFVGGKSSKRSPARVRTAS